MKWNDSEHKKDYDTTISHCTHYKMPLQWDAPLTENNLPLYERVEQQIKCLVHRYSLCGLHIVYHISVLFFLSFLLFLMYGLFIFVYFNSFDCYGTFLLFLLHNFAYSQ